MALRTFVAAASLLAGLTGCGAGTSTTPATPGPGPRNYFAPTVIGGVSGIETYSIDEVARTFAQTTYALSSTVQEGAQVLSAGSWKASPRNLLSLSTTVTFSSNNAVFSPTVHDPPLTGGFAVQLPQQAGALVQLVGAPAIPATAATQCPSATMAQTYQYVTIPGSLIAPGAAPAIGGWDPTVDTAYGTIDVTSVGGGIVIFSNPHQFTLPSAKGSGSPANPATGPVTGACSATLYGSVVTFPFPLVVQNPGDSSQKLPPAGTLGIGPSGLLVEDNGYRNVDSFEPPQYQNTLGAGTGAVGMPRPGSPVDLTPVLGAQYLGFVMGTGVHTNFDPASGRSSHLASFGFTTVPASCNLVAPSTKTMIYGGHFTNDDPSTSLDGFGNCDLALDLGLQDPAHNGLFPNATVWIGAGYPTNTTAKPYSFQAVAIAGQLAGKSAIFLVGEDSTEPWAIYLLQSN